MRPYVAKINKRIYYGWMIVLVAALSMFFSSPGQTYSISVFNAIYENELGYTKTMLSTGYSIATTFSGLLIVLIGRATDKVGHKKMYIIVTIMLAVAAFFSSMVMNIWMIYISFFLLRFFGQGSLTLLPSSLVPQWFEKKRAFALSLMILGSFFGALIVPRLNLWLIETFEWQNAWRIWGISLLVVLLPIVILFVFNKPHEIGISMENEPNQLSEEDQEIALDKESWKLSEALKTKEFWFIGIMSMIVPMFTTGFTFHFYSIMNSRSVENETAAWIIGLMAFPILLMPFVARAFIDKTKPKYVFALTQVMILISMTMLLFWVNNAGTALIFVLFYGLAGAVQAVTLNTVWPLYFGRKYLGSIRGMTTVFMVIGSALGPLPFGVSFDQYGSFNPAIVAMMIFTVVAILLSLLINKPEKKYLT
ncbi:MAG: MFS transporter [Acholeplasmataceae bacterium]|nr:MFS transporter [Acholeplasmataceae bacterium]